jgi:uncharacterized protein (TIGR02246 family)
MKEAQMSANDPSQLHQAWEKAFNGGDLDALLDLYEPDATLIPEPEKPVSGHAAIREALVPLLALTGRIQIRTAGVIPSGDLAVVYGDWSFVGGTDPDGNNVDLEGHSTELMRRQSDGSWLDVIDDPYSRG